jgi:hypothetical protein
MKFETASRRQRPAKCQMVCSDSVKFERQIGFGPIPAVRLPAKQNLL